MEKAHLTSQKARFDAGSDTLPILEAKLSPNKINDLRSRLDAFLTEYAANSYKILHRGITPQKAPETVLYFQAFLARSRTIMRTDSGIALDVFAVSALNQTVSSKCLSMAGLMKRVRWA